MEAAHLSPGNVIELQNDSSLSCNIKFNEGFRVERIWHILTQHELLRQTYVVLNTSPLNVDGGANKEIPFITKIGKGGPFVNLCVIVASLFRFATGVNTERR